MAAEATEIGTRMGRDAFYSWEQGRELIEGATIGLAYALLPVWRYVQARVEIVDRVGDVVTLRGVALDLASIVSVERDYTFTIAPPPGKYANKPDQRQRWEAMQTQSASSKAVRGAILGMLPPWLVGAAINAAKAAASASILGGKTFDEAAGVAVKAFAEGGVKPASQVGTGVKTMVGKKVVLDRQQDPSLIAGVVTRIGDNTIDGSVRGRLESLERKLLS